MLLDTIIIFNFVLSNTNYKDLNRFKFATPQSMLPKHYLCPKLMINSISVCLDNLRNYKMVICFSLDIIVINEIFTYVKQKDVGEKTRCALEQNVIFPSWLITKSKLKP